VQGGGAPLPPVGRVRKERMLELGVGPGSRLPDAISRKRLIGGLLIKEGLITKAALQEALCVQAKMESYQPIGQILVDRQLITRKQLDFVLERYRKKRRLGDVLIEAKVLTETQLESALTDQRRTDLRLGDVLLRLNLVTERQVREALSTQLGIVFVDLDGMSLDSGLAGLLSEGYARRHRVIPVRKTEDRVTVAMEEPADLEVLEDLRASVGRIDVVTTTRASFDRALARIYGQGGPAGEPAPEQHQELREADAPSRGDHEPDARVLADPREERDTLVREGHEREPMLGELGAVPGVGRRVGGGGGDIMEVNAGDLRTVVDTARQMVADWDRFVASIETLTRENGERRASLEQLEATHRELRQENEGLREARDRLSHELQAASQALAELRAAHESLVREHDSVTRALREVRERYDALQGDRQFAADQLEAVLHRIKL
jgi:hypothetical protein